MVYVNAFQLVHPSTRTVDPSQSRASRPTGQNAKYVNNNSQHRREERRTEQHKVTTNRFEFQHLYYKKSFSMKQKTKTINFQFDFTFWVFNWIIFVYLCSFRKSMDSARIIGEFQFCILFPVNYLGTLATYMLFVHLFAFWTDFIS